MQTAVCFLFTIIPRAALHMAAHWRSTLDPVVPNDIRKAVKEVVMTDRL